MSLRRWLPWTLLSVLGLLTLGAILTSVSEHPRPAPIPPSVAIRFATSYDHVQWTALSYPGLHCGYYSAQTANVGATGTYVLEQVAEVRVTGRSAPLAMVAVGCNLNHLYANLYAFSPGPDPSKPVLVQALAHYQATEQLLALSTAINRISMKVAGYTPSEALCCPGEVSVRRWVWRRGRFQALPSVAVTSIVMPKVVGLTSDGASRVLVASGIASFSELTSDDGANSNGQSQVVAQSPAPGAIIHPPNIQVTVTVR
jgi:hypothetical protein